MYIKQGGGKIKRKLLLSVLFIFGFALVLNMNFSSAVTVNQTNTTVNSVATTNTGNLTVANTIKAATTSTVKAVTNTTAKTTTTPTTVKATTVIPPIVGGLTLAQVKDGITRTQKFVATNGRLPAYVSYGSKKIPMAQFQQILKIEGLSLTAKTTTVKAVPAPAPLVNGLTLAQVKDGLTRTQSFVLVNGRLPDYVTCGSKQIPLAQFEQILKTEGLKLTGNVNRPIYITSDNINNSATDNARINSIIAGLKKLGLTAFNMGLGPNKHDSVLTSGTLPSNALIVDIYGGVDAGLIKEMGSAWYKTIKGAKKVYSVFWPPSTDITGLAFLPRAHDDNYDPASFTGIANPAQYLLANGYNYIHSGSILNIITAIFYQAKI